MKATMKQSRICLNDRKKSRAQSFDFTESTCGQPLSFFLSSVYWPIDDDHIQSFGSRRWNVDEWDKNVRRSAFILFSKCTMTFARHSIGITQILNLKSSYSGQQILGMSFSEKRREDNFFAIIRFISFSYVSFFVESKNYLYKYTHSYIQGKIGILR